jgi:TPR repeat protein
LHSKLGDTLAIADLGQMYERGRGGLPVDLPKAITPYQEAAQLGNDYAKEQLRRLGKLP